MPSDLERAFNTLKAKSEAFSLLWAYYDGNQPLVYTNDRLREVFQNINARFSENWCAVVVDSEHERIRLKEFTLPKPESAPVTPVAGQPQMPAEVPENPAEKRLNELYAETELNLDADDVHLAALVCGESYVFAWKDDELGVEAYYHDPRLCHVFYDPEHPRQKLFAAKWWVNEDDERRYLNLYYADHIEYYASTQKAFSFSTYKGLKELKSPEDNPFGAVPFFHFHIDRRKTTSRLDNAIEPQNAINKLVADMMVAAEFGAFNQRVIISQADPGNLKNAPNQNWWIPAGDGEGQSTQVMQLAAAQLDNYLKAMDRLATTIGVITRTPKHYFYGQGGDPSGEALIAMEAPLNRKAQSAIDGFKPVWAELAVFLLKLDGVEGVQRKDVTPVFDEPATVQPRTEAEIVQAEVNAGIPLVTALRRAGWTDSEIQQMEEDKAEETRSATSQITPQDAAAVEAMLNGLNGADNGGNGTQPVQQAGGSGNGRPQPARPARR